MLLLKPGYALVILHNNRRAVPDLKDITVWEYNEQAIKMKRGGDKETADALYWSATHANRAMGDRTLCGWKNFPRFLVALDRAAPDWNRKRDSLADQSLRHKHASSPLQFLLQNDQLFVAKGCGSPKAFFEPYLR